MEKTRSFLLSSYFALPHQPTRPHLTQIGCPHFTSYSFFSLYSRSMLAYTRQKGRGCGKNGPIEHKYIWWPLPLFLIYFDFLHWRSHEIHFFACGLHCGCILKMSGSLLREELSCCVIVFGLKSVWKLCHTPTGLEPMSLTSVAHYLNGRQQ